MCVCVCVCVLAGLQKSSQPRLGQNQTQAPSPEQVGSVILFLLPAMCVVESIDHMCPGKKVHGADLEPSSEVSQNPYRHLEAP